MHYVYIALSSSKHIRQQEQNLQILRVSLETQKTTGADVADTIVHNQSTLYCLPLCTQY